MLWLLQRHREEQALPKPSSSEALGQKFHFLEAILTCLKLPLAQQSPLVSRRALAQEWPLSSRGQGWHCGSWCGGGGSASGCASARGARATSAAAGRESGTCAWGETQGHSELWGSQLHTALGTQHTQPWAPGSWPHTPLCTQGTPAFLAHTGLHFLLLTDVKQKTQPLGN